VQVLVTASGKSLSVARTLYTLGQDVLATGFLGGDTGKLVRDDLDRAGIRHDFVAVEPKTRTCITVIDRSTGTATELVEETQPVDPKAYEQLLQILGANLRQSSALVLSGTLPPQAPQDFYARCTRAAAQAGIPVILDARGEPLRLALEHKPAIVKPNRQELQDTAAFAIDSDDALRRAIVELIRRGPKWAVITDGPRDVIASDGDSFWRITPPPIKPINPIGSGDAFAAGLAIALLNGQNLPDACRLGAACGAANALSSPAGHARPEDVQRLLPQVQVKPL